ncbi:MAG: biopolymer transporter ExbD [Planctomycetaceae bacterium]|jgi:biopolymer transport protein ExbD|nr:biopolymer transporter ExbD [Planctomycetaceae bacterium]
MSDNFNNLNSSGLIFLRRRQQSDVEMDITPMIDCVFLLLIFFLVCSTMGRNTIVQLPKAQYGVGINPKTATVLTVAGMEQDSTVYLGDGTAGTPLSQDKEVQRTEIIQAVEQGIKDGKSDVVIRADRKLFHGEVVRIESIASSVRGVNLFVVVDDR